MKRHSILVFAVILSLISASNVGIDPAAASQQCGLWDTNCQEEEECEPWDSYCQDDSEECQTNRMWCGMRNNSSGNDTRNGEEKIVYSEPVTCKLLLKEVLGGLSGYCDASPGTNLDHCLVIESKMFDPYTVKFLCANGRPSFMAKADRNEVSVRDLDSSVSFREPFWIVCDEGMGNMVTNKRCYDSEFSDGDDWETGCKVDKRIGVVYEYPDTFVWYVCP